MPQTEIRLFGHVWVRRSDGTVVQPTEWRTTKTLDLLRLLALEPQLSVSVTRIRALLWPDSDDIHAGASLRTAASQLRKVLGPDTVERQSATLVLRDVWVDVQLYAGVLEELDQARRGGDDTGVVALARQADALYACDVETDGSSGDWLVRAQYHWRERRVRALVDGAEAADRLRWMRDCADLAGRACDLAPHSDEAARVLMRGLAGMGRTSGALAAFERLRRALAEEFGVDPAPQTRALHLQLLRGTSPSPIPVPSVDHPASGPMIGALARLRSSEEKHRMVWLRGASGSGRDFVVQAACAELGLSLRNLDPGPTMLPLQRDLNARVPRPDVVVLPKVARRGRGALADAVRALEGSIVVVPVEPSEPEVVVDRLPFRPETVDVPPLTFAQLHLLAADILQAEPSSALLARLRADTGSLAGLVHALLRRWLEEAALVWTPDGMDLAATEPALPEPVPVGQTLRRLPGLASDVLAILATADTLVTDAQLESVVGELHPDAHCRVAETLDRLLDAGLLQFTPAGFQLANRQNRTEIIGWIRPSVRRRLQQLVARHITGATRGHFGLAGPELDGRAG